MKTGQREWTCPDCGCRNEIVVLGETLRCESCTEGPGATSESPSKSRFDDDARKRGIVARLRERYGEAREFVLSEPLIDAQAHGHLEWILGKQSNPEHAGAALDAEVSELIVLWLQDLARELDSQTSVPDATGSDRDAASTEAVRQAAAEGLRAATRDFAEEFLRIHPSPVAAS